MKVGHLFSSLCCRGVSRSQCFLCHWQQKQLLSKVFIFRKWPRPPFCWLLAREWIGLVRLILSLSIGISGLPVLPCGSLSPKFPIESTTFLHLSGFISLLGLPLTKHHRLTGLYKINLFLHSSGGWKSKIKVLV